jgi:hypothetical protein
MEEKKMTYYFVAALEDKAMAWSGKDWQDFHKKLYRAHYTYNDAMKTMVVLRERYPEMNICVLSDTANIIDFSPYHENKTDRPDRVAFETRCASQYRRAVEFCEYYFNASFPNGLRPKFDEARHFYHGNALMYIACHWNTITNRYEITTTTAGIIKANRKFWKYDFVGKLTDFAA